MKNSINSVGAVIEGTSALVETNISSLDELSMAGNYSAQYVKESVKLSSELKLYKLQMKGVQQKIDIEAGVYDKKKVKKSKTRKSRNRNKLVIPTSTTIEGE